MPDTPHRHDHEDYPRSLHELLEQKDHVLTQLRTLREELDDARQRNVRVREMLRHALSVTARLRVTVKKNQSDLEDLSQSLLAVKLAVHERS
jgi:chromosome segregation ATPase